MATNPDFEKLVAALPASFAADFRLRPMPKLSEAVKSGGNLHAIASAHDMAMQQWAQDAERSINERITQTANKPLGKAAAAAPAVPTTPVTPVAPTVTGVTSVNGETGVVELDTDAIPDTVTNRYLNDGSFLDEFNHNGFMRNSVPLGDLVMIPSGKSAVFVGPFTAIGTLTVDGIAVFLPVP
jgi:hypothetical protein